MKTTTIPPLRVTPDLRRRAEAVLEDGETLSSFVLDSLNRNIDYRTARQEFVSRGLESSAQASVRNKYVSADAVIAKLTRRLDKAKQRMG